MSGLVYLVGGLVLVHVVMWLTCFLIDRSDDWEG